MADNGDVRRDNKLPTSRGRLRPRRRPSLQKLDLSFHGADRLAKRARCLPREGVVVRMGKAVAKSLNLLHVLLEFSFAAVKYPAAFDDFLLVGKFGKQEVVDPTVFLSRLIHLFFELRQSLSKSALPVI